MDPLTSPLTDRPDDRTRLVVYGSRVSGSLILLRQSRTSPRLQLLNVHPPDIPRLRAALEKWDADQP